MREYEFTFVVQPEITEEGLEGICQKFEATLERAGSTRLFYEDWGRRRLAYEIQKFQKGHYMVLHYLDSGAVVPEMERLGRLEDSVLRFLTVLADDDVADIEARQAEAAEAADSKARDDAGDAEASDAEAAPAAVAAPTAGETPPDAEPSDDAAKEQPA